MSTDDNQNKTISNKSIGFPKTCMTCAKYLTCRLPAKKHGYACDVYAAVKSPTKGITFSNELGTLTKQAPMDPLDILLSVNITRSKRTMGNADSEYKAELEEKDDFEDIVSGLNGDAKQNARDIKAERDSMFNIAQTMSKASQASGIVPHDLKVSDVEFPEAKNFYQFSTGEDFLRVRPYLMQLIIASECFSEICPICSDMEWVKHNRKVGDTYTKMEKHICFMENGICPSCKTPKSKLVLDGLVNPYNEMAMVAGQRCVSYGTLILTQDGLMEIGEYSHGRPYGFSDFKLKVYNGEYLEETSDYYISKPEIVNKIVLQSGHNMICTDDHPVLVVKNNGCEEMVKTKDLVIGDWLKVKYDTQVFGNKLVYMTDIINKAENELLRRFSTQQVNTAWKYDASKQVLKFLPESQRPRRLTKKLCVYMGLWVAEGRKRLVSNTDTEVLDYIRSALEQVIEPSCVYTYTNKTKPQGILIKGALATVFLEILLGQKLSTGSNTKCIPLIIRQGPKEYQTAFLRGVFEGDGGVEIARTKNKTLSYHGVISHTTISRKLHMQISAMLLNLGVMHRTRTKKTWATNGTINQVSKTAYVIEIQDKQFIELYAAEIGFITQRKTARMQELIEIYNDRRTTKGSLLDKVADPIISDVKWLLDKVKHLTGKNDTNSGLNVVFGNQYYGSTDMEIDCGQYIGQPYFGTNDDFSLNMLIVNDLDSNKAMVAILKIHQQLESQTTRKFVLTFSKLRTIVDFININKNKVSNDAHEILGKLTKIAYEDGVAYIPIKSLLKSNRKFKTYDFTLPQTHRFITGGFISKNSGKSALVAMMSAYIIHKLIKLQKPTEVYGLLPNSILHGTFVALTYSQARDTLWQPLYQYLQASPWFSAYHARLDEYAQKYGEEFYKLKDSFVYYKHRSFIFYASAPHSKVLRGRTRCLGSVDELGLFDHAADSERVRTNGKEVAISIERSLLTIRSAASRLLKQGFNDVPTGYFLNVSSPFSQYDTIMQLYEKSKNSTKILGYKLPTWEVNPTITMEDLAEEFAKNPVTAWRDYGSVPPLTSNAFIGNKEMVTQCYRNSKKNGISTIYKQGKRKDGSAFRYAEVDWVRSVTRPSCIAIDAGYCLRGDELVPTENGIFKLSEMLESRGKTAKVGEVLPLKLQIGGLAGEALTQYWIYSGKKQVYKVTTESGHCVSATADHKFCVLRDGKLQGIKLKNITLQDMLCIPTEPVVRTTPLKLNIVNLVSGKNDKHIKIPRYMSTDLAFVLGAIASDGHFNQLRVAVSNTNLDYLNRVGEAVEVLFGIKSCIRLIAKKGQKFTIEGRRTKATKDCFSIEFYSIELCGFIKQLGVLPSDTYGQRTSFHIEIPWSILQADRDSQIAWLASYIEGDGQIRTDRAAISVWSKSDKLLHQMQVLLNAHSIMTNIRKDCITTASSIDAFKLYKAIKPYLTHKFSSYCDKKNTKLNNLFGFPSDHVKSFLASRRVNASDSYSGKVYLSDDSRYVIMSGKYKNNFTKILGPRFLYDNYDNGKYDSFLSDLKLISELEYDRLINLFTARYRYSSVTSIVKEEITRVYDLSMADSDQPYFTASGLLVHNSNNSFAVVSAHKKDEEVFIDLVAEVTPLPGIPVNHTKIFEELIGIIIERQNVVYVTADRWNSLKLLSDVEAEYDIQTKQYSLKYRDFFDIKSMLDQSTLHLPKPSMDIEDILHTDPSDYPMRFITRPSDHLIFQMLTVMDTGNKILKGQGELNDDIFRALCLAVHILIDPDNAELFSKQITTTESGLSILGSMRRGKLSGPGSAMDLRSRAGMQSKVAATSRSRRN